MTPSQVLQKRMEEFEKEFGSAVKEYDLEFGPWDGTSLGDDLKSFSLATSLALIESVIEMVGKKKDEAEKLNDVSNNFSTLGAIAACIDLLKLLSEEKEKIKKMI